MSDRLRAEKFPAPVKFSAVAAHDVALCSENDIGSCGMPVAFADGETVLQRTPIMTPDIKRILVPIDFSANSRRALDYAHGLALKFDAALHLVHVCEVPSMMTASMDAYAIANTEWSQRLGAEAETQLVKITAALRDVTVSTEVLFGNPAKAIAEAAENNGADLIVMGTHGHGAIMHLLMGNVAERVVRTASCPVLTVREPRPLKERAIAKSKAGSLAASVVAASLLLAPALVSNAAAQEYKQTTTGGEVFRTYCASCHGASARGDGPLASSMLKKPANLTEIAKRNGDMFPSEMVFKIIDGRQPVKGHGGPDMPVWGEVFTRSRDAGDAERVKAVIQSLVEFLGSIQLRSAHDPHGAFPPGDN
jgi:nucleotide-binding universal stress UspA family protein